MGLSLASQARSETDAVEEKNETPELKLPFVNERWFPEPLSLGFQGSSVNRQMERTLKSVLERRKRAEL